MDFKNTKSLKRSYGGISTSILFVFLLLIHCADNANQTVDPTSVAITVGEGNQLQATVIYDCVEYTEDDWPSNFSDPTFTWQEKDPKSSGAPNWQVSYNTVRRTENGENLWTFTANDSEGIYYYYAHVSFTDEVSQGHQGQSPDGNDLYKKINRSDYDDSFCDNASGYIRVPYVYGGAPDINGEWCGKSYDNGYRGIDCSGLAWYSGYEGDEGVDTTTAADLEVDYGKNLPIDSLNKIIDEANYEYLDGCMVFVDADTNDYVDHVGIILNQDFDYCAQVIHATAAAQIELLRYEHGCMVMREDLDGRSYWTDDSAFVDIGREPMN